MVLKMPEYIDREAFKKSVEERYCKPCKAEGKDHNGCWCRACWVDDMIDEVECFQPSDVAPVVRCKDCKHKGWVQEPCHGKSVDYCKIWDCTLRNLEATFCSYGEQKDGGASDVRIAD